MSRLILPLIALIAALACPCAAGPVASELESFYNLMPDYSSLNGAESPAISPDGHRLAFAAGTGGIWILSDVEGFIRQCKDGKSYPVPKPWQLQVPKLVPKKGTISLKVEDEAKLPALDWSPDNRRLAFILNSRLYVAEAINFQQKTARIRLVADLLTEADIKSEGSAYKAPKLTQGAICRPKWSPDSTKIAFLRAGVGVRNTACVVDVASGNECVLGDDAGKPFFLWQQPWSPDSKWVVYGSETESGGFGAIRAVSPDGMSRRDVVLELGGAPSWSPQGERIAFVSVAVEDELTGEPDPIKAAVEMRSAGMGIFTVDRGGGTKKLVSRSDPEVDAQIAKLAGRMAESDRLDFEREYGSRLTKDQLDRLHAGKMDFAEMMKISFGQQLKSEARRLNPAMAKEVDELVANSPATIEELMEGFSKITDKYEDSLKGKSLNLTVKATGSSGVMLMDLPPVWSPDGSRMAFVRQGLVERDDQLWVLDVATGKQRCVFSSGSVSSVNWTADGRLIVLQSSRDLGFVRNKPDAEKSRITWPSYSEVWLLQLK